MKLSFQLNGKPFYDLSEKEQSFFVGDEYLPLTLNHATQIILLDKTSSEKVKSFAKSKLGFSIVYTDSFFTTYRDMSFVAYSHSFMYFPYKTQISLQGKWNDEVGLQEVRSWLYTLKIPFSRPVFLWYGSEVILIPWKLVVRYWDAFAWSVGVAMYSFDSTASWVCEFHHEEVISCWSTKPLI